MGENLKAWRAGKIFWAPTLERILDRPSSTINDQRKQLRLQAVFTALLGYQLLTVFSMHVEQRDEIREDVEGVK